MWAWKPNYPASIIVCPLSLRQWWWPVLEQCRWTAHLESVMCQNSILKWRMWKILSLSKTKALTITRNGTRMEEQFKTMNLLNCQLSIISILLCPQLIAVRTLAWIVTIEINKSPMLMSAKAINLSKTSSLPILPAFAHTNE